MNKFIQDTVQNYNKKKRLLFIIIFLTFFLIFFLNFYNFTLFNDGIEYLLISENLKENFSLKNITTTEYNKFFHSPQLGSTFILTLCKLIMGKYYFILYLIILSTLWLNFILNLKNYYFFKNLSNSFLICFSLLVFFQFDIIRASTSFYNEGIYFPLFLSSFIALDNLIEKNIKLNFQNQINIYLFFIIGPFLQIFHFFILLSFLIIFIINLTKKNILKKTYILFLISIISTLIYYLYYNYLTKNGLNVTNFDSSEIKNNIYNLSYNFQKFFNVFVTPFNLHLLFTNFKVVQSNIFNYSLLEIFISIFLFLIFIYSMKINFKFNNFHILVILLIFFSFVSKLLIVDYDVRYNIYTNFFILFYFLLIIEKILVKSIFIRFLLIVFIIFTCGYNFKNFFNLNINEISSKNENYSKNKKTLTHLKLLKKVKHDQNLKNINKFDLIITSINPRIVYQVFKTQSCYIKDINNCTLSNDKLYFLIISEKEKDYLEGINYNDSNMIKYIY